MNILARVLTVCLCVLCVPYRVAALEPMPRVIIAPALDEAGQVFAQARPLDQVLRKAVAGTKKLALLSQREMKKLGRLFGGPYAAGAMEVSPCPAGGGLSDHLLLKSVVLKSGNKRVLALELLSVENACLLARVEETVGWDGFAATAVIAVNRLVGELKGRRRTAAVVQPVPAAKDSVPEAARSQAEAQKAEAKQEVPADKAPEPRAVEKATEQPAGPLGDLAVKVEDENGRAVKAKVLLDGKQLDDTPYVGKVPLGRHTLQIRASGYHQAEKEITIEKTRVTALTVVLTENRKR